jgi:hypothetical protein
LTTSTQFPDDKLASSARPLEPDRRRYRNRGYYLSSRRSVISRLTGAAIECATIAILVAGFILTVAFALDLSGMLVW